jgi:general secretion pathway protein A
MYRKYFGMKRLPFSIAPDPRYLYMSDQHREALAHLLYGIRSDGGFVLLTGEVGTGKTTICRRLLETLTRNIVVAFIIHPSLSVAELLAAVCDEFGISYPKKTNIKGLVDRINNFLLDLNARRKKAIVIIDEAQNLSNEVLEEIRLLTNLETNERKLLQIILIGQPELKEKLAKPELSQLAQRIVARCHLGPLSKAEVINYVNHRLEVARGKSDLFSDDALNSIYEYSGGIPRLINLICDRALLGVFVQEKEKVDGATLAKAASEVLGVNLPATAGKLQAALLAGIVFLTGLCLLYYFFNGFESLRTPDSEEASHMSSVSKPLPAVPEPPEANASGTGPNKPDATQTGVVSKPLPAIPQPPEANASGTGPNKPDAAQTGVVSKPLPAIPQPPEANASGTGPNKPDTAQTGVVSNMDGKTVEQERDVGAPGPRD